MYLGHGIRILFGTLWIGAVIYLLTLATRLVRAIEKVADKLASKP